MTANSPETQRDIESQILALSILGGQDLDRAMELRPDSFSNKDLGLVFTAIQTIWASGSDATITRTAISNELKSTKSLERAGGEHILEEIFAVEITESVEALATSISTSHVFAMMQRSGIKLQTIGANAEGAPGVELQKVLKDLTAIEQGHVIGDDADSFDLAQTIEDTDFSFSNPVEAGASYGFKSLDEITGGMASTDLVTIAAVTGGGKSSFVTQVALHNALQEGKRVILFSLEMSAQQVTERLLSQLSGLDLGMLKAIEIASSVKSTSSEKEKARLQLANRLTETQLNKYAEAKRQLLTLSKNHEHNTTGLDMFSIHDKPIDIYSLKSKSARMVREAKAAGVETLIIVDYIALLSLPSGVQWEERQALVEATRELKQLALAEESPVIQLSQFNRNAEESGAARPRLNHLAGSTSVAQNSNLVLCLHRPSKYDSGVSEDEAEMVILKSRSGRTGAVKCGFDGATFTFYDTDSDFDGNVATMGTATGAPVAVTTPGGGNKEDPFSF